MELSATARVILGTLSWGPRTGYDIKALVDKATRHFWAASYGQIYPELRRLQERGLVTAATPEGGRRRTAYAITPDGERALRAWLTSPAELSYELRDEGLLKFFFGAAITPAEVREQLESMAARHRTLVDGLRALEEEVLSEGAEPRTFPHLTLLGGIELHEFVASWCERMQAEMADREGLPADA
jgi:DNA-binding PadR family transcriptional regulator